MESDLTINLRLKSIVEIIVSKNELKWLVQIITLNYRCACLLIYAFLILFLLGPCQSTRLHG